MTIRKFFARHNARPPPQAIAPNTAGAFAVKLSIPHLNRSSRMSASSLLLAWLAWLAFVCTSSADADVVAGPTSKCLDTCRTAGDGICQDELMEWVRLGRVWRLVRIWDARSSEEADMRLLRFRCGIESFDSKRRARGVGRDGLGAALRCGGRRTCVPQFVKSETSNFFVTFEETEQREQPTTALSVDLFALVSLVRALSNRSVRVT